MLSWKGDQDMLCVVLRTLLVAGDKLFTHANTALKRYCCHLSPVYHVQVKHNIMSEGILACIEEQDLNAELGADQGLLCLVLRILLKPAPEPDSSLARLLALDR